MDEKLKNPPDDFKLDNVREADDRDGYVLMLAQTSTSSKDFKAKLAKLNLSFENNQTSTLSPDGRKRVIDELKKRSFTFFSFLMENKILGLRGQQKLI